VNIEDNFTNRIGVLLPTSRNTDGEVVELFWWSVTSRLMQAVKRDDDPESVRGDGMPAHRDGKLKDPELRVLFTPDDSDCQTTLQMQVVGSQTAWITSKNLDYTQEPNMIIIGAEYHPGFQQIAVELAETTQSANRCHPRQEFQYARRPENFGLDRPREPRLGPPNPVSVEVADVSRASPGRRIL
jgi:hypothetical protein